MIIAGSDTGFPLDRGSRKRWLKGLKRWNSRYKVDKLSNQRNTTVCEGFYGAVEDSKMEELGLSNRGADLGLSTVASSDADSIADHEDLGKAKST